jgi:hypothetical protein
MPKMRRKADLPRKTCAACGREMVWRKAWEKVWDEVKYCSDACRHGKMPAGKGGARPPRFAPPEDI